MAVYRIDLDLLEETKEEHEKAVRRMAEAAEDIHGVVSAAGEDVYQGADADTFRDGLTRYADTVLTEEGERLSRMGKALGNALDDGRRCKKICNDFPVSLGGEGNGKAAEDMRGELYCDPEGIMDLKFLCTMVMMDADTVRRGADEIDDILSELKMVSMDSGQYTDVIREGCDKVDRLEQHSAELTVYAVAAEGMDDNLRTALGGCVPSGHADAIACAAQYADPRVEALERILRRSDGELTQEEREEIDRNLGLLMEEGAVFRLEQLAGMTGSRPDGKWTEADAYLSACLLAYGERECEGELTAIVYRNLVDMELSGTRDDSHLDVSRTTFIYTASFDEERTRSVLGMLDPEKDALAYHSLENRMYYHERIEKMVYGQAPEEPGADFRVSFTAMDGRLVSVMELDDRESVYQSSEADVVERWLTPGYRLTGKEEERAKEMTAEYFSDKNFLKETFRNLGTGEIGKSAVTGSGIVGIPEEEYREAVRMYHLAIKLDDAYAFSSGLVHALPFCDTILEKIPGDTFENYNNIRAQADLQSPVASAYGEVTGNVLEYWIGAELMKKIPGVNAAVAKIGNAAGKGTEKALNAAGLAMVDLCGKGAGNLGTKLLTGGAEKIGAAVGRSTVNIVGDLILDTTLDTIPNAAGDAADGLGGKAIAVNAVKNTGKNLGYNMLGEGIGSLFHAAGKIKNRGDAAAGDTLEDVARHLDDMIEGGSYGNPNKIGSLLDGRPELTGSTRDKLLTTVQDPELNRIVNELYRPGATVGDGGTAAILVEEFNNGSSTHLIKAKERLKQLSSLASSGKLGLNDLDVVEALIDDLEYAIGLFD